MRVVLDLLLVVCWHLFFRMKWLINADPDLQEQLTLEPFD